MTTDDERLDSYRGYERATRLFTAQLGAENRAEWRDHAPAGFLPSLEDEE